MRQVAHHDELAQLLLFEFDMTDTGKDLPDVMETKAAPQPAVAPVPTPAFVLPIEPLAGSILDAEAAATPIAADWQPTSESFFVDPLTSALQTRPWQTLSADELKAPTGLKTRVRANLAAIQLAKDLASANQPVDHAQRVALSQFSGWGGIPQLFDESRADLADERQQLIDLVGQDAFDAARAATLNSHYTDPAIVDFMWTAVQKMGFNGGKVIETSAGVGHFLAAMPQHIQALSHITAVELEPVSAEVLRAAYGSNNVTVITAGIESAPLPAGAFDLAISNPPFGDFKTADSRRVPFARWSIHNYFFGRAMELLRPGGVLAFVTSAYTLDAIKGGHREWLGMAAELITAIRLPFCAHKAHANTEVATDIVFLRKLSEPSTLHAPAWTKVSTLPESLLAPNAPRHRRMSAGYHDYNIYATNQELNMHYVDHPECVVGKFDLVQQGPGRQAWHAVLQPGQALETELTERLKLVPSGCYARAERKADPASVIAVKNDEGYLPGQRLIKEGRVYLCAGDTLEDVDQIYTGKTRARLLGLLQIAEAASAVVAEQSRTNGDLFLDDMRRDLNTIYDGFRRLHGPINEPANRRVMKGDPKLPLLLSLEVYDTESKAFNKADIFSKRTVRTPEPPAFVDDVNEAFALSLAHFGRIDTSDMATRMRRSVAEVCKKLEDTNLAFIDPHSHAWVPADEYLSGPVQEKIDQAIAAGPIFDRNVRALRTVLPAPLEPKDIEARLGAPWVPLDVIVEFANDIFKPRMGETVKIDYAAHTHTYTVGGPAYAMDHTAMNTVYGTSDRTGMELLESALNMTPPTVTMKVDEKQVVDRVATMAARDKWNKIKEEFRSWVWLDHARAERLVKLYNDKFNQLVPRKFSGAHLTLPGLATTLQPYTYQKNAAWRIITTGNTLLAHVVGAGKTLTAIITTMEMRRLGRWNKPLHVVPNHLLEQYTAEFLRSYPNAKVYMATDDDLSAQRRKTFVARVATGDWDAVVMTASMFERIPMSPAYQEHFLEQMIAELRATISAAEDRGAKMGIKQIEKRVAKLRDKVADLMERGEKDRDNVYFDDLGVDAVTIDEAHSVKNLGRMSKLPRIANLPNTASNRAFDMLMKTRFVMDRFHDGQEQGVVFMTATPVSNSMAEMWVFKHYLRPLMLDKYGVGEFDAWAGSYGEAVTAMEVSPEGSGYRANTRFCKFVNVPELIRLWTLVADIVTKDHLEAKVPRIEGDKPTVVVCDKSEALSEYIAGLVERAEDVRGGKVKPDVDNMLKVTNDGRCAALDMRMVAANAPRFEGGKIVRCAQNVHAVWLETAERRGTQLVFSDIGTPSPDRFNAYSAIREELVTLGIPLEEIEFIHDHNTDLAKENLFRRVRAGEVRVLLGSTSKLGTGTNVQRLLAAIHQLDAPWRPSDVEQRDGRGVRQGNTWDSIKLFRYVTEGSFDTYQWNTLEVKARFIDQIERGDPTVRTVEDVTGSALTYAEIKALASGNPLVLEKAGVDSEVHRLSMVRADYHSSLFRSRGRRSNLEDKIRWVDRNQQNIADDAQAAASIEPAGDLEVDASMTSLFGNQTPLQSVGKLVQKAYTVHGVVGVGRIARIAGFKLGIEKEWGDWMVRVEHPSGLITTVPRRNGWADPVVIATAVTEHLTGWMADRPTAVQQERDSAVKEIADIDKILAAGWEHEEKYRKLLSRQAEIEAMLDLAKDEAGTAQADALAA